MGVTSIEWTDRTWSPIRVRVKADAAEIAYAKGYISLVQIAEKMAGHVGPHCEHVSDGCKLCYAETNNHRCLPANGTGLPYDRRSRDLVDSFVDEKILLEPLKWRKPQRIFVENQSDLFGEWNTDEQIDRVFAAMSLDYDMHWSETEGNVRRPHHTWQVLTKRPDRMLAYVNRILKENKRCQEAWFDLPLVKQAVNISARRGDLLPGNASILTVQWIADGMPGLWLGVSVENQEQADKRIPLLLQTPAAVRFVSYEPALGPVDFRKWLMGPIGLNQIIVGGESGPGSRSFNLEWARAVIEQTVGTGTKVFIKQLGAKPLGLADRISHRGDKSEKPDGFYRYLNDRKGGEMSEWPEWARVREFPGPQPDPLKQDAAGFVEALRGYTE